MSGAAGMMLVPDAEKNPLNRTSYGVGEVIKDAIQKSAAPDLIMEMDT
jgi:Glycerate kinase